MHFQVDLTDWSEDKVKEFVESPWFDYYDTCSIHRELRCRYGYSRSQGPEYKERLQDEIEFLEACIVYYEKNFYSDNDADDPGTTEHEENNG